MSDFTIGNYNSPYSAYDNYSPYAKDPETGKLSDQDMDKVKDPEEDDKNDPMPGRKNPEDCETCKHRKYQDGSDEENVSFKTASHVSPAAAGAAVRTHEGMHVSNAYSKAEEGGGEVVSAYVVIHTSVCPECGRTYVSGGDTHTQIKYPNQSNPYQQGRMAEDAANLTGQKLDYNA